MTITYRLQDHLKADHVGSDAYRGVEAQRRRGVEGVEGVEDASVFILARSLAGRSIKRLDGLALAMLDVRRTFRIW